MVDDPADAARRRRPRRAGDELDAVAEAEQPVGVHRDVQADAAGPLDAAVEVAVDAGVRGADDPHPRGLDERRHARRVGRPSRRRLVPTIAPRACRRRPGQVVRVGAAADQDPAAARRPRPGRPREGGSPVRSPLTIDRVGAVAAASATERRSGRGRSISAYFTCTSASTRTRSAPIERRYAAQARAGRSASARARAGASRPPGSRYG